MKTIILLAVSLSCPLALANNTDNATWQYTIRAGDTLWSLAAQHLTSPSYVPRLQAQNHISNAYRLTPGNVLNIPYAWIKQNQSEAVLEEMSGTCSAKDAKGGKIELTVGQRYAAGTQFSTGQDAMLRLKFQDGSTLLLNANTRLALQTQIYYPSTGAIQAHNQLDKGSTGSSVIPNILMPSRYEIRTPSATTTVRGTEFRVDSSSDDDSKAEVLRGKVNVNDQAGSVDVPAGFGTRTGKNAGQTVKLPAAPDLSALLLRSEFNPPLLQWQQKAEETGYRVTLSGPGRQGPRLQERQLAHSRFYPQLPANGEYSFSARASDASGLEGFDDQKTFALHAYPLPPLLLATAEPLLLRSKTVELYTGASDGYPVQLQVASQPDFQQPLLDSTLYSRKFVLTLPNTGTWYWRSARLDAQGQPGPYSEPQELIIKSWYALLPWQQPSLMARHYPVANALYTLTLVSLDQPGAPPFHASSKQPAWSLLHLPSGRFNATLTVDGDNGYHAEETHPSLTLP